MRVIRLYPHERPRWGWQVGMFGYRAFCCGWFAVGPTGRWVRLMK